MFTLCGNACSLLQQMGMIFILLPSHCLEGLDGLLWDNVCEFVQCVLGGGTLTSRVANRLVYLWIWGSHIHISFADIEPYLTATYNFSLLPSHCPEGARRDQGRRDTGAHGPHPHTFLHRWVWRMGRQPSSTRGPGRPHDGAMGGRVQAGHEGSSDGPRGLLVLFKAPLYKVSIGMVWS